MPTRILVAVALAILPAADAAAQQSRFELGRRLLAFERTWDRIDDAEARSRALPLVESAVQSFFTLRFASAGRDLDRARFALDSATPADAARAWAAGLAVSLESRLLTVGTEELRLRIDSLYEAGSRPDDVSVRLGCVEGGAITDGVHAIWAEPLERPLGALPAALAFAAPSAVGDHLLLVEISREGRSLARYERVLSVAGDLATRRAALAASLAALPEAVDPAGRATLRQRIDLLEKLTGDTALESEVPGAALLEGTERLAATLTEGGSLAATLTPGEHRIWLPVGRREIPFRLFVPHRSSETKPVPLVLALHGAGGSENMLFEGCGGRALAECRERGWYLAAPRLPLFGRFPTHAALDALVAQFPAPPSAVFVAGHSMGGGAAMGAAEEQPDRFAAIAVLGTGWGLKAPERLRALPIWIGVGSRDFARDGAKNLAAALAKADAERLVYQEVDGIEHLLIVQVALPDVFAFFAKALEPAKKRRPL